MPKKGVTFSTGISPISIMYYVLKVEGFIHINELNILCNTSIWRQSKTTFTNIWCHSKTTVFRIIYQYDVREVFRLALNLPAEFELLCFAAF